MISIFWKYALYKMRLKSYINNVRDIFTLCHFIKVHCMNLKAGHLPDRERERESDRGAVNVVRISTSEAEAVHAYTHVTIFI